VQIVTGKNMVDLFKLIIRLNMSLTPAGIKNVSYTGMNQCNSSWQLLHEQ
jgi:hypothetical protein